MSIQMTIVFTITVIEMILISLLISPLPVKFQNLILNKFEELINNRNFQIILAFSDVLISIMFVDACKIGISQNWRNDYENGGIVEFSNKVRSITWDSRAKIFFGQRNMYVLGAVLVMQIITWFIILQIKSIIKNKKNLSDLVVKNESKFDNKIEESELNKLQIDVDTLRKQYDSAWESYKNKESVNSDKKTE